MSNRLSQAALEVLILSNAPIPARVSQVALEVLVLPVGAASARLSQVALEVLVLETPSVAETTQFYIILG